MKNALWIQWKLRFPNRTYELPRRVRRWLDPRLAQIPRDPTGQIRLCAFDMATDLGRSHTHPDVIKDRRRTGLIMVPGERKRDRENGAVIETGLTKRLAQWGYTPWTILRAKQVLEELGVIERLEARAEATVRTIRGKLVVGRWPRARKCKATGAIKAATVRFGFGRVFAMLLLGSLWDGRRDTNSPVYVPLAVGLGTKAKTGTNGVHTRERPAPGSDAEREQRALEAKLAAWAENPEPITASSSVRLTMTQTYRYGRGWRR